MNDDNPIDPSTPENEDPAVEEHNDDESLPRRSARLEEEALERAATADAQKDALYESSPEDQEEEYFDSEDAKIEALQREIDKAKDQALRALAEADNARKRAMKEREDASRFAISGFARDLLDVADNLRRALDAVPEDLVEGDVRVKNLLEGIEATERELLKSFANNGIEALEPLDEPFDPNFHEVMFEIPDTGKPAGTIMQVIETGYVLNDRILRPARVGIAKDDSQGDQSEDRPPSTEPGGQIDTEVEPRT